MQGLLVFVIKPVNHDNMGGSNTFKCKGSGGIPKIILQSYPHPTFLNGIVMMLLLFKIIFYFQDYWLSLVFKKLVGKNVLSVISSDLTGMVRLYAHCSNSNRYVYCICLLFFFCFLFNFLYFALYMSTEKIRNTVYAPRNYHSVLKEKLISEL